MCICISEIKHSQNNKMNLTVKNALEYDGRFPTFRQPTEIGYFSLDGDREFHNDKHQLKYLIMPPSMSRVEMDLNVGYSDAVKKEFARSEKLNSMLRWILANKNKVKENFTVQNTSKVKIDFVSYRGLLTDICTTIYENKDDWLICATKYKSVIYLCRFDTEQDVRRRANMKEKDKLMSSWGYKFEQYMTSDSKNGEPNVSAPVNENEEYDIMVKGRLKEHTLLYGAEVDCVDPAYINSNVDPKSTKRYVELKTSRTVTSERQDWNFCRHKLLKWWAQSFLVGIRKIICGYRDDQGIVRNLRSYHVSELPKIAEHLWSPSACLNFCASFLDYMRNVVIKDDPHVVYKFYWKPESDVTCEELQYPSDYQILPEWYIKNIEDLL